MNYELITVTKAEVKDGVFLVANFNESLIDLHKREVTDKRNISIHEDLKNSIQHLHKHMVLICELEQKPKTAAFNDAIFEGYECIGFSIVGNDEKQSVSFIGYKLAELGSVKIVSPSVLLTGSDYKFYRQMNVDIQSAIDEVLAYLFEGKKAPEAQLDMFSSEVDTTQPNGHEDFTVETEKQRLAREKKEAKAAAKAAKGGKLVPFEELGFTPEESLPTEQPDFAPETDKVEESNIETEETLPVETDDEIDFEEEGYGEDEAPLDDDEEKF